MRQVHLRLFIQEKPLKDINRGKLFTEEQDTIDSRKYEGSWVGAILVSKEYIHSPTKAYCKRLQH